MLEEHLERLETSAEAIRIKPNYSIDETSISGRSILHDHDR